MCLARSLVGQQMGLDSLMLQILDLEDVLKFMSFFPAATPLCMSLRNYFRRPGFLISSS